METHGVMLGQVQDAAAGVSAYAHAAAWNPSCLDLAKDCGLSRAGSSVRFAQGPDF